MISRYPKILIMVDVVNIRNSEPECHLYRYISGQ